MDYKELLKKAHAQLPEDIQESQRFEVPKVKGHVQGNKTIISNFLQITNLINRKPEHLLKFILKSLATPGEIKGTLLYIGTKVSSSRLNEKITEYVDIYVTCKTCGKPETKLSKENNIIFMTCQACGAKASIQSKN